MVMVMMHSEELFELQNQTLLACGACHNVPKFLGRQILAKNGPVYKTNLAWTKSLSDYGLDQIWLCKQYLPIPKIWSGLRSGPKRDMLMCKDQSPIEFGLVPNLDM